MSTDLDTLIQAHLKRVFNERDPTRRAEALQQLYAPDAVVFEPDAAVTGHDAISAAVDALHSNLPPDVMFKAAGPAVGHHGLVRLNWTAAAEDGTVVVSGTDVAQVENGVIKSLHVFVNT